MAGAAFPSGEPGWQVTDLEQLASANALKGFNPVVFSAIAEGESGYENAGAGINPEGYGGYFGLGANESYGGGAAGQTSSQELLTNSSASFEQQAITVAIALNNYMQQHGGNFQAALEEGFSTQDYENAINYLNGASPTSTSYSGTGNSDTTPSSGSTSPGSTSATLASNSTSQAAPSQPQQSGVAGILQDIDAFLNPHVQTTNVPLIGSILNVPSDIETTILEVAGRGLFTVFFLFVTLGGIYMIVKKPANAALGVVSNYVIPEQRIAQAGQRLKVAQASESRKYAAQGLQDPFA